MNIKQVGSNLKYNHVLLGMATVADRRHKSLEWLKRHQQHENTPANDDGALKEPNIKNRRCDFFFDEDDPEEEQTSEVAAEADGLRRAIKGEFDAWLLIPEA